MPSFTLYILNLPFASNCLQTISADPSARDELGQGEAEPWGESSAWKNPGSWKRKRSWQGLDPGGFERGMAEVQGRASGCPSAGWVLVGSGSPTRSGPAGQEGQEPQDQPREPQDQPREPQQ